MQDIRSLIGTTPGPKREVAAKEVTAKAITAKQVQYEGNEPQPAAVPFSPPLLALPQPEPAAPAPVATLPEAIVELPAQPLQQIDPRSGERGYIPIFKPNDAITPKAGGNVDRPSALRTNRWRW